MHIPDNYLSPSTCAAMGAVMVPVWARAVKKVNKDITKKKMPLMGIGAAFSFIIMMFNVPLPGGTTGHAIGATLVALLLGPEGACIAVTIALLLQALLFGDGGILAFGANCFNMAFVIPFSGYFIYNFFKNKVNTEKGDYAVIFIASYIAINLGALIAAIEFGLQPLLFKDAQGMPLYSPYPLAASIPAMLIPHLLVVGILEGIITTSVYGFIKKVSPGSLYDGAKTRMKPIYALIFTLICLTPLGLLAAGTAWGEWGADEISSVVSGGKALGFVPKGMKNGFNFKALMPGYFAKGMSEKAGYILSALLGVAVLLILFKLMANKKHNKDSI